MHIGPPQPCASLALIQMSAISSLLLSLSASMSITSSSLLGDGMVTPDKPRAAETSAYVHGNAPIIACAGAACARAELRRCSGDAGARLPGARVDAPEKLLTPRWATCGTRAPAGPTPGTPSGASLQRWR